MQQGYFLLLRLSGAGWEHNLGEQQPSESRSRGPQAQARESPLPLLPSPRLLSCRQSRSSWTPSDTRSSLFSTPTRLPSWSPAMEGDDTSERHQPPPPDHPRPGSSAITHPAPSYTSPALSWSVPAPVVPEFQYAKSALGSGPSKAPKGVAFASKVEDFSAGGGRSRGSEGGEGGHAESGGRGTSSETLTSSTAEGDSHSDGSGDKTQGDEEESMEVDDALETRKRLLPPPPTQQPGSGGPQDAPRPNLDSFRLPPLGTCLGGRRTGLFPTQIGFGILGGRFSSGQRGVVSPVNRASTSSSPALPSSQAPSARSLPTSTHAFGLPRITPTPFLPHGNLPRLPSTKANGASSARPGSSTTTPQQPLAESSNSKKRPHPTSSSVAADRAGSSLVGRHSAKGSGGPLARSRTSSGGTTEASRSRSQRDSPPKQKRHKGPLGDVWERLSDVQSELEWRVRLCFDVCVFFRHMLMLRCRTTRLRSSRRRSTPSQWKLRLLLRRRIVSSARSPARFTQRSRSAFMSFQPARLTS